VRTISVSGLSIGVDAGIIRRLVTMGAKHSRTRSLRHEIAMTARFPRSHFGVPDKNAMH
jgi:hypothetical protein